MVLLKDPSLSIIMTSLCRTIFTMFFMNKKIMNMVTSVEKPGKASSNV
jgi:hypothetical protein